jgi:hypothetical protein
MDSIPDKLGNMRIRQHADCSITIPRHNRKLEKYLDEHYERQGNQLKWYPQIVEGKDVFEHENQYEGHDGYIVGKGPSLDYLNKSDFADPESPIICINESIHVVEALDLPNDVYGMQQDAMLKQTCLPKRAPLMMPRQIQYFYPELSNKYIYRLDQFTVGLQALSAQVSLAILKMWGCKFINLVSFDACVNKSVDYAKAIGHEPVDDPTRFLLHCKRIANTVHSLELGVKHITPEGHERSSVDTPQPTLDSQPEHHVPPNDQYSESSQDSLDSISETEQVQHETPTDHSDSETQS